MGAKHISTGICAIPDIDLGGKFEFLYIGTGTQGSLSWCIMHPFDISIIEKWGSSREMYSHSHVLLQHKYVYWHHINGDGWFIANTHTHYLSSFIWGSISFYLTASFSSTSTGPQAHLLNVILEVKKTDYKQRRRKSFYPFSWVGPSLHSYRPNSGARIVCFMQ